MLKSFQEIYQTVLKSKKRKTIAIAMADDLSVLSAIKEVEEQKIARALLIGNAAKIDKIAQQINYPYRADQVIDSDNDVAIATLAVESIRRGQADILMKGHISTPVLMKAVLQKETGLRRGEVLSHVAVAEVPTYSKLLLIGDGGINILPDLETKKSILRNLLLIAEQLQIEVPKVAVLCPIEKVNEKIQETVDAENLRQASLTGQFGKIILEGPIAMDVVLSAEAAQRKEIESRIAGDTDIILVPNLTTGNALIKSLMFLAEAKVGGLVVGAKAPIILLSRADSAIEKLNSIVLSLLASQAMVNPF
jgi:phosphate butyryltransferase